MLARRASLKRVLWDPTLKRADHSDFFTRTLGVLVSVFNPELRALHVRTPFDAAYMSKRLDLAESLERRAQLYPRR